MIVVLGVGILAVGILGVGMMLGVVVVVVRHGDALRPRRAGAASAGLCHMEIAGGRRRCQSVAP